MKTKMRILYLALSVLFIVFASLTGHAQASGNELFADAPGTAEMKQVEVTPDPTVVRSRNVYVLNLDALQGEDTITLNLFSGVSFNAVKHRVENRGMGNYTWFGSVEGVKNSQVILTVENGGMAGNITIGGQMYQVRDTGSGIHSVREIDQSRFPECFPPTPVDAKPDETDVPTSSMQDDGSTIDIMVVYTAQAAVGGNIESEIQLAIDETNQSYANSGINPRMNLVHKAQVTYTESGNIQTDRNRLQNKTDGHMDNVHTLRDTYGADMVTLWVANGGGYCGIAYIMTTVSTTFENYAFQVTARSCATGYYSFGHEFGHIQSARHDWYVDPTNNSPYTYNHGYVDPGDAWRTIMAYGNACQGCTRIQYWSNPDVLYGGQPMGVPEGQYHAADNRKTLNNTAWTVANFRQSVSSILADIKANGSDGPVTVSPSDPVSISISLDPGGKAGQNADWWIAVHTPFAAPLDWYTYVYPTGWVPGINLCAQTGLFYLYPYEVLNMTLPVGNYTFYFAIDDPDGAVTGPWWGLDSVEVTVQ